MKFRILAAIILPANEMRRTTSNGFVVKIVGDAPTERKLIFCDHTYLFSYAEEHVVIEKMRKMKVSTAAQTLRHRVASTLKLMSELGNLYIL